MIYKEMMLTSSCMMSIMQSQRETLDRQIWLRKLLNGILNVFLPFVMVNPIVEFDMVFSGWKNPVTGKNVYNISLKNVTVEFSDCSAKAERNEIFFEPDGRFRAFCKFDKSHAVYNGEEFGTDYDNCLCVTNIGTDLNSFFGNRTSFNYRSVRASDMDFIGSYMNDFLDDFFIPTDEDFDGNKVIKIKVNKNEVAELIDQLFNNNGVMLQEEIDRMLELFIEKNIHPA
jgi:hypothetical protein